MKYITASNSSNNQHIALLFPDEVTHSEVELILPKGFRLLGAGFVKLTNGKASKVYGFSESLSKGPHELDLMLVKGFHDQGLNGLDFANIISAAQLGIKL